MVGGAAGLIEEVAASKISSEDRYSHRSVGFRGLTLKARRKLSICRPQLTKAKSGTVGKSRCQLQRSIPFWRKYRTKEGFENYDKLTDADRNALEGPITALAEDLAQLRGNAGAGLSVMQYEDENGVE